MLRTSLVCLVFFLGIGSANATLITVDARNNSTSGGGVGMGTGINLNLGDYFSASAALDDLWSAGNLPRWSNADGLVMDLFATGSDESGQAAGTKIGRNFGLYNQHGLSLPYGTLVGSLGGNFFAMGTSYSGNAIASGELLLWYWDVNRGDNTGAIDVMISTRDSSAVPEPSVVGLFGLGLLGLGLVRRKRD